jgi:hypothetical protein
MLLKDTVFFNSEHPTHKTCNGQNALLYLLKLMLPIEVGKYVKSKGVPRQAEVDVGVPVG